MMSPCRESDIKRCLIILKADEAALREMIKQDTRHFAKRQLTWFRREPSVTWVDFSQVRREDALSYMLEQLKEKEII